MYSAADAGSAGVGRCGPELKPIEIIMARGAGRISIGCTALTVARPSNTLAANRDLRRRGGN
jgi:hypothetical protein